MKALFLALVCFGTHWLAGLLARGRSSSVVRASMSGCNQWVPSALQAQPPHPRQRRVRKQLTRNPLQAVSRMCFFPHRSSCMSRADVKLLQGETGRTPRCCISFPL